MAAQSQGRQSAVSAIHAKLNVITSRIQAASKSQLPFVATQVAAHLSDLRPAFSALDERANKADDTSQALHRLRTQLATLLQARSAEERWSAIVLLKAVVEAAGVASISVSGASWIKHLLQILKRPTDPCSSRVLATLVTTRIFRLTYDTPNLVREITTPALPTFISTCLNNSQSAHCSDTELQTYLEAFIALIPKHSTIFRTNESQIAALCRHIVASDSAPPLQHRHFRSSHRHAARKLLVLLHHCAAKQGGSDKWVQTIESTIKASHETSDILFRAVHETGLNSSDQQAQGSKRSITTGDCALERDDAAGLPSWIGVYAGAMRLRELLNLLRTQLELETKTAVSLKIGLAVNLISRICSVSAANRANNEVSQEERLALFSCLPQIHAASTQVMTALLVRLGPVASSVSSTLFELALMTWQEQRKHDTARKAMYELFKVILTHFGNTLTKADVADIAPLLKRCCEDYLPSGNIGTAIISVNGANGPSASSDNVGKRAPMNGAPHSDAMPVQGLKDGAQELLLAAIVHLSAKHLPPTLRALIDRTAVLTKDKRLLIASTMNPPTKADGSKQASLLPMLAQLYPGDPQVESLLRPRMPFISPNPTTAAHDSASEAGEVDGEDDSQEDTGDEAGKAANENGQHQAFAQWFADEPSRQQGESQHRLLIDQEFAPRTYDGGDRGQQQSGIIAGMTPDHTVTKRHASPVEAESAEKRLRSDIGAVSKASGSLEDERSLLTAPGSPSGRHQTEALDNATASNIAMAQTLGETKDGDDDDDGSDFEMPPLTMDADTDEED